MKNVRKKGNAFYYDHGGKPRIYEPLGTDEKVALERAERIATRKLAPPGTVDAMLKDVMEHLRTKVKTGTYANYRGYHKHLSGVFGYMAPADLTQAHVLNYLRTCPRTSFRGEIALLSAAYVLWMDRGRVEFNPCFGVRCKRKGSKRDRLLSDAEVQRILDKAPEKLAVAIELAYATGLRISDVCGLRWQDFADSVRTIKTGARQSYERTPELDALLARAKALQSKIASMYVLCARGGRQWKPDGLRRHWDKAVKAAKVEDAHFHDLRAKGATDMDRAEGQRAAQHFLGHKHAQTTEIYLRDKRATVVRPLVRKKA